MYEYHLLNLGWRATERKSSYTHFWCFSCSLKQPPMCPSSCGDIQNTAVTPGTIYSARTTSQCCTYLISAWFFIAHFFLFLPLHIYHSKPKSPWPKFHYVLFFLFSNPTSCFSYFVFEYHQAVSGSGIEVPTPWGQGVFWWVRECYEWEAKHRTLCSNRTICRIKWCSKIRAWGRTKQGRMSKAKKGNQQALLP